MRFSRLPLRRLWSGLALTLVAIASTADAATFTVNTTSDARDTVPGDGVCSAFGLVPAGRCSLRAAIMEANAQGGSHTIVLPEGVYQLDEAGNDEDQAVTGDLDIRADITLQNDSELTPLLTQSVGDRFFEVHPGARLALGNIALAGGQALSGPRPYGGAILVWYSAEAQLDRTLLTGNLARRGGAIHSWGNLLVARSSLRSNNLIDATPDDSNQGAAISVERSMFSPSLLSVLGSSISDNGLSSLNEAVPNTYAVLVGNGAHAQIDTVSLIDNARGVWGRGVHRLAILRSTIAGNAGFGLRFDHFPENPEWQLGIGLTVIAGNGGISECRSGTGFFLNPQLSQLFIADNFSASTDPACGFSGSNDIALAGWPFHPERMAVGLQQYYQPVPERGLVDVGPTDCEQISDQRGLARPLNATGLAEARCDIGAIEFDGEVDLPLPQELFGDGFED